MTAAMSTTMLALVVLTMTLSSAVADIPATTPVNNTPVEIVVDFVNSTMFHKDVVARLLAPTIKRENWEQGVPGDPCNDLDNDVPNYALPDYLGKLGIKKECKDKSTPAIPRDLGSDRDGTAIFGEAVVKLRLGTPQYATGLDAIRDKLANYYDLNPATPQRRKRKTNQPGHFWVAVFAIGTHEKEECTPDNCVLVRLAKDSLYMVQFNQLFYQPLPYHKLGFDEFDGTDSKLKRADFSKENLIPKSQTGISGRILFCLILAVAEAARFKWVEDILVTSVFREIPDPVVCKSWPQTQAGPGLSRKNVYKLVQFWTQPVRWYQNWNEYDLVFMNTDPTEKEQRKASKKDPNYEVKLASSRDLVPRRMTEYTLGPCGREEPRTACTFDAIKSFYEREKEILGRTEPTFRFELALLADYDGHGCPMAAKAR